MAHQLLLDTRWTLLSWMAAHPGPRTTREIATGVGANVDSTLFNLRVLAQISAVSAVRVDGPGSRVQHLEWERNEGHIRSLADTLMSALLPR